MAMTESQMPHSLQLRERNALTMTGVREVISFDENTVVLRTSLGILVVQGRELHLKTLSPEGGQVAVEGTVTALNYEEPRSGSWKRRLFG
jgi:sporulation protein YabP